GGFVITWQSEFHQDGSYNGIYAQRYDNTGAKIDGEIPVNFHTDFNQSKPKIGMDLAGNFVIAYESAIQEQLNNYGIYAKYFDTSGVAPTTAILPANYNTIDEQDTVALAVNGSGAYVIAWESYAEDGDQEGIYARSYSALGNA